MTQYAKNTSVSVDRSVGEIQSTLIRYGASKFMYGIDESKAMIAFEMNNRHLRFKLELPNRLDDEFWYTTSHRKKRGEQQAVQGWEQACRSSWRALLLCVKAKLESVASKIETFDEAFLPHIILPSGRTFSEEFVPQIEQVYNSGSVPRLMSVN